MIQAVLAGMTHRAAAEKHGVSSGNVARWVREHDSARLRLAPPPVPDSTSRARDPRAAAVAQALGPRLRADLRETIGNLTGFLADVTGRARGGDAVDMHQVAAAARALDALLSRAADVLAFDNATQAPADADALRDPVSVAAEIERRRRVCRAEWPAQTTGTATPVTCKKTT